MRIRFLVALLAAGALTPVAAIAQGAVGGAVTGAAVGAAVGGPVGAVVGAGVGGTVGVAVAAPPPPVVTYVQGEDIPSVTVEKDVVVGEALPATIELHTIPKYKEYRFAIVNHQRVIVAPKTRKVIKIIK